MHVLPGARVRPDPAYSPEDGRATFPAFSGEERGACRSQALEAPPAPPSTCVLLGSGLYPVLVQPSEDGHGFRGGGPL
eukprot:1140142-Pelagomonas_calceolata.AAC.5